MTRSLPVWRIEGMLVGAAVGDALGWPQENRSNIVGGQSARDVPPKRAFRAWQRNGGTQYGRYTDPVGPGEYSDDTQLLLSVARSCARGNDWIDWFRTVELPQWPLYQRGGGGAVLRAARNWAEGGRPPWRSTNVARYFDAGANGVAMRIAPHAVVAASEADLFGRVVLDGISTHGHPRAIYGAVMHALASRHVLSAGETLGYGELVREVAQNAVFSEPAELLTHLPADWIEARNELRAIDQPLEEQWARVGRECVDLLAVAHDAIARGGTSNDQEALSRFGCFDRNQSGSGTVAAIAATYLASRNATNPTSALLQSAYLREADSDTIASMTGSLIGALHGPAGFGNLGDLVQDRNYLSEVACDLIEQQPRSPQPIATTTSQLRRWTASLFDNVGIEQLPDGRLAQVTDVVRLQTKANKFAARITVVAEGGQTLHFDRLSSKPSATLLDATGANDPRNGPADPALRAEADVRVDLPAENLASTQAFYESLLGLRCKPAPERLFVGAHLTFSATRQPLDTNNVRINIRLGNLAEVAARLERQESLESAWGTDRESFWVRDPNGYRIKLTEN